MNGATPVWQKAAAFAARAHQGQLRKDGRTPYFSHPVRVALTIACVFGFNDEQILAAALLHDTIEDTGVDRDELTESFGDDVAEFVARMSKDMRLPEAEREREYDRQLAEGPWQARLLKLADVFDNMSDPYREASCEKIIEKARRALKLTAGDGQLAEARTIVQAVVDELERRPAARSAH